MKVVLFCGGLGTRVRAYSENIPKPMVPEAARNGDELVLSRLIVLLKHGNSVRAWTYIGVF
jgi:NDP-sugar pyrophosphorylase family protein